MGKLYEDRNLVQSETSFVFLWILRSSFSSQSYIKSLCRFLLFCCSASSCLMAMSPVLSSLFHLYMCFSFVLMEIHIVVLTFYIFLDFISTYKISVTNCRFIHGMSLLLG